MVAEKLRFHQAAWLRIKLKKSISASAPTIAGRVVGDCPGGTIAAGCSRRREAAVLIFAYDFDLLSIARDVVKGK